MFLIQLDKPYQTPLTTKHEPCCLAQKRLMFPEVSMPQNAARSSGAKQMTSGAYSVTECGFPLISEDWDTNPELESAVWQAGWLLASTAPARLNNICIIIIWVDIRPRTMRGHTKTSASGLAAEFIGCGETR